MPQKTKVLRYIHKRPSAAPGKSKCLTRHPRTTAHLRNPAIRFEQPKSSIRRAPFQIELRSRPALYLAPRAILQGICKVQEPFDVKIGGPRNYTFSLRLKREVMKFKNVRIVVGIAVVNFNIIVHLTCVVRHNGRDYEVLTVNLNYSPGLPEHMEIKTSVISSTRLHESLEVVPILWAVGFEAMSRCNKRIMVTASMGEKARKDPVAFFFGKRQAELLRSMT